MAKRKSETEARACPICGKPAIPDAFPFCSTRCADVDLHRWLGGHYAIPAEEEDEEVIAGLREDDDKEPGLQ